MNWNGHKELYGPVNLAKILHTATAKWKGYVSPHLESEKDRPAKFVLIDGDKE